MFWVRLVVLEVPVVCPHWLEGFGLLLGGLVPHRDKPLMVLSNCLKDGVVHFCNFVYLSFHFSSIKKKKKKKKNDPLVHH